MLSTKLKEAAGNSADATLYVDDVFSTYLYTGNGSTQTITNGIDLAGKGGLVWTKDRVSATNTHKLTDTARGYQYAIQSSNTNAQEDNGTAGISSFGTTGYGIGSDWRWNKSADTYVSWTFRKAAKFFDVVTFTSNSLGGGTFSHSLGSAPGFIIIKSSSTQDQWTTYHRSLGPSGYMYLNTTAANNPISNFWNVSSTSVTYANDYGPPNASMVAYLFAHDTSSTGIIQCGSVSATGSTLAEVNLGWEPQWLLIKGADINCNWSIIDSMRGFTADKGISWLFANASNAEGATSALNIPGLYLTSTGFKINSNESPNNGTGNYIYMAIRMPNKPPTSGTQVYLPTTWAGNGNTGLTVSSLTSPVDLAIVSGRGGQDPKLIFSDRLRGSGTGENGGNMRTLVSTSNVEESASSLNGYYATLDYQNSVRLLGSSSGIYNGGGASYVLYSFKRAPGFFDEVCYTGTGSATTQAHNLTVAPELMIVKCRSYVLNWDVYNVFNGNDSTMFLDLPTASATGYGAYWNTTTPTASVFSIGNSNTNLNGKTYVAYLFATLAGIQYINSYVGDGTTGRVINCGFSAGARFICIKATSTTGSWWVWDSARGITSANDPALQLNSTAAEITSADAIDPSSSGFIVNQEATCSINASGVSYLVWAIA